MRLGCWLGSQNEVTSRSLAQIQYVEQPRLAFVLPKRPISQHPVHCMSGNVNFLASQSDGISLELVHHHKGLASAWVSCKFFLFCVLYFNISAACSRTGLTPVSRRHQQQQLGRQPKIHSLQHWQQLKMHLHITPQGKRSKILVNEMESFPKHPRTSSPCGSLSSMDVLK